LALLGITIKLTGGYENSDGAGPFAILGLLGVTLFVVAIAVDSLLCWSDGVGSREPAGNQPLEASTEDILIETHPTRARVSRRRRCGA
jgi:hypothetical protein